MARKPKAKKPRGVAKPKMMSGPDNPEQPQSMAVAEGPNNPEQPQAMAAMISGPQSPEQPQ